jgi:hypothetical protein
VCPLILEEESEPLTITEPVKTIDEEFEAGIWMRSCPRCQKSLRKRSPLEFQRCDCGWEWKA